MQTKRLLLLMAICLYPAFGIAQESGIWASDLEVAKRAAAQSGRLVLVHFWAPWCAPCQTMETNIFSQPGFNQALAASCVPVKLNSDDHMAVCTQYGVTHLPSDIVLTPDGRLVDKLPPAANAAEYMNSLSQIVGRVRMANRPAPPTAAAPNYNAVGPPGGYGNQQYSAPPRNAAVATGQANEPPQQWNNPASRPGAPGSGYSPAEAASSIAPTAAASGAAAEPGQSLAGVAGAIGTVTAPVAAAPVLGLDGFCPVALCEQHKWVQGSQEWGFIYRNRTYLFSSQEAKQKFWNNPERYAPVAAGTDPVIAIEEGKEVPGERAHGMFVDGRVYLFANEQTLEKFRQNPDRYAPEILQARR